MDILPHICQEIAIKIRSTLNQELSLPENQTSSVTPETNLELLNASATPTLSQGKNEVNDIEIEPSARTSVPNNSAVQPVHAIDDSNNSILHNSKKAILEIKTFPVTWQ